MITSGSGDFVFANVSADTYTVEVTMPSFKTLNRTGLSVSAGSRVAVGDLTIAVGGASEVVNVKGEAPPIQSTTGERSFTVATEAVSNLPMATRSFAALVDLTPGVSGGNRIGNSDSTGGGSNNFMMDGVSTMEPGSNRLMVAVNVESIAEVKVLTSNYQAEYGRSSGLQVTAVTKSGTNRFRGSVYDVERNSDWNTNSKVNKLNGDPKTTVEGTGLGLFGRRSGRQAGRQQQAVLLLRAGIPASISRQQRRAIPDADGAGTAGRLLPEHGQQRESVPVHQGLHQRPGVRDDRHR